jgi:Fe-S oxidoreductase
MGFIPPVMDIIKENILANGNPLGLSPKLFTKWAQGLDLPSTGDTFIYTGLEYQMLPYNDRFLDMVKQAGAFGEKMAIANTIKGLFGHVGIDLGRIFAAAKHGERYDAVLRRFVEVLRSVNISPAYLYEDEPYAGALLYEFGFHDELAEMGRRIRSQFIDKGIKRLIVVSPHSLEMFKTVYPKFGITFDMEIIHYIQALGAFKGGKLSEPLSVSIHDPCHLVRSMGIVEEPRNVLLKVSGCTVKEIPHVNKKMTSCCGAPIESYLPHLGQSLASLRLDEFEEAGLTTVLTLCPFCYHNLLSMAEQEKRAITVREFIDVIAQSIGGANEQ